MTHGIAQTCAYLADLAAHNTRDWFEANRARYEADWLAPAGRIVKALAPRMAALDPPHKAEPRVNGSIRRTNRDTRFSKDKTPYDPRLHLVFWTGDHPSRSPAIHLVLYPDGLAVGGGQWGLSKEALANYRRAIGEDRARVELARLLVDCEALGLTPTAETLKRVPAGFDADAPYAGLLRRKNLVVTTGERRRPVETLDDPDALAPFLASLAAVDGWLLRHAGEG